MDVRIELSVTPEPEPKPEAEAHAHGADAVSPAENGNDKGKGVAGPPLPEEDVEMQDASASASVSVSGFGVDETTDSPALAPGTGEPSRATTPGEGGATTADEGVYGYSGARKRKGREEEPQLPPRAARARRSPPQLAEYDRTITPPPGAPPGKPKTTTNSLHIFAPPPPTDQLPLALQHPHVRAAAESEPTSAPLSETDLATDVDSIRKEAAAGYESRLRARAARAARSARDGPGGAGAGSSASRVALGVVGVSASGRDVRIGTSQRLHAQAIKKKGKGKAEVEVPNQDFCSACKGIGRFLCCDGCPRSFHFACLEPPLRLDELPAEETWLCKKCRAERAREEGIRPPEEKDLGAIPAVFKALSKQIDDENPAQFKLPVDVRRYFVGVSTNAEGEYVDSKDLRTKVDRKGFLEDRDPFRLRDGKHNPIECHVCGGTALPKHSTISDPEATWRQIVSCDYCPLSWHLDCMSPPMTNMPSAGRKWMCPNHAEHVMPKRRTVQDEGKIIDVTAPGKRNNGVIEIPSDSESESESSEIEYEDMVINRKTYRVPEKVIKLDFWEKLRKDKEVAGKRREVVEKQKAGADGLVNGDGEAQKVSLTEESLDAAALLMTMAFSRPHLPTTSLAPAPAPASAAKSTIHAPDADAMDVDEDNSTRDPKASGPGQNSREGAGKGGASAGPLQTSSPHPRHSLPQRQPHPSAAAALSKSVPSLPPKPSQAALPPHPAASTPRSSLPGAGLPVKPDVATPRQSVPASAGLGSLPAKPTSASARARPSPVSTNSPSLAAPIIPSTLPGSPIPVTPSSAGGQKIHPPPWPESAGQQVQRHPIAIVPQPSSAPATPVTGMPAGRGSNGNSQAAPASGSASGKPKVILRMPGKGSGSSNGSSAGASPKEREGKRWVSPRSRKTGAGANGSA
ncbi:hypothetical protein IAT38_002283 [Cryptococcus sp. DSM 104549]